MIEILLKMVSTLFGVTVHPFFSYASTRLLLSSATTLVLTIFIGPWFIRRLQMLKIGQKVRTDEAPQILEFHEQKQGTPTMGGVLVIVSMLISSILWMDLKSPFTWLLGICLVILACVGGYDDYLKIRHNNTRGTRPKWKIFWQLAAAGVIACYLLIPSVSKGLESTFGLKAPVVKEVRFVEGKKSVQEVPLDEFSKELFIPFCKAPLKFSGHIAAFILFCFYLFVIAGSSNAVNLTDGLDGLAAGLLMICAAPLIIVAFASSNIEIARYLNIPYIEGSHEIAIFLAGFVGGLLGFLWYNSPPAQVFMGDIGSLAFGGILGVTSVLLRREFLLALVGGLFVVETLSVILQVASFRLRGGKRIFLCAPIHHHFECMGIKETKVVIRFWIVGLLLALLGILSLKLQ
jgi:phospho-N-acetylmuramoyl-pentapeptide-transferase